jgi:hypothetical protein
MTSIAFRASCSKIQATINTDLESGRIAWRMIEDLANGVRDLDELREIARNGGAKFDYAREVLQDASYLCD